MSAEPLTRRYGDGYGTVSPAGTRYGTPRRPDAPADSGRRLHGASGAMSRQSPRLALNLSPRWSSPQVTPRLHPDEIAENVRTSSYIRSKRVIPPEYVKIIKPAPPPKSLRPSPRELAKIRQAEKAAAEMEAARLAAEQAALKAAEEAAAAAVAAQAEMDAAKLKLVIKTSPRLKAKLSPRGKLALSPRGSGLSLANFGGTSDDESSSEESEEDEFDDFDDEEDARRLAQVQKSRGGGGKKDGIEPPSPFRRMSLADMREAGLEMQGMAKLRQELSEVEIQEYRDFFDLVDEDGNKTIDAHELKQAMTMMGMECTDELIQAMVGEVKDSQQELEMDFEEFLVLMAIFVGPRADEQEKELRLAFDVLDEDGGGTIDMNELTDAFLKFGEKVSQEELDGVVKIVDTDGDGEIDFDEFKVVMMTAVDEDAPAHERVLRRKMRTTVRTLIMRQRFTSAIAAFDERYNFLRFTDAKIIAPADQSIVRIHHDQTVFDALALLRADNAPCAPVYADEARRHDPIGFLYMIDIIQLMLTTMKQMFKAAPSTDPVAIQQRMNRVAQDASTFSKIPVAAFVRKDWKPIRPGFSVYDLGFVLSRGVADVPYVSEDGDLEYLISQEGYLAAFNEESRVRLGGVGRVTAEELGCIKKVARVTEKTALIEAFKAAESTASTADPQAAAAVVCNSETEEVMWFVSAETLNAPGLNTPSDLGIALSKPVYDLYRDLEGNGRKEAETCKATASVRGMVKQMVESGAQRLWVVDNSKRPVGMVSLTMIIECIMDAHASRKEFLA